MVAGVFGLEATVFHVCPNVHTPHVPIHARLARVLVYLHSVLPTE